METHKSTRLSSERQKWGKIFNSMVQMLHMQQTQLETLVKERKILEDIVKMQQDRWVSDTRLYENKISQMKSDMLVQEMDRSFDASKFNFAMGLKNGDGQLSRLKHELTDSELEDFKEFFDVLCEKCSALSDNHSRNPLQTSKSMEEEVRMLRQAYEKLKSEKDSEVSALVMEKKFVWNQYNIMEEDYASKLRSKNSDVEQANLTIEKLLGRLEELQKSNHEKDDSIRTLNVEIGKRDTENSDVEQANLTIEKLLGRLEELQKSNHEKDDSISTLNVEIGKRDTEKNKLREEIGGLYNELELLRKSKTVSTSPVLKRCNSNDENSFPVRGKSNIMVKKDASSAEISHPGKNSETKTGSRSSKRNKKEVMDSPKLFSSTIKIPKLKSTFHR